MTQIIVCICYPDCLRSGGGLQQAAPIGENRQVRRRGITSMRLQTTGATEEKSEAIKDIKTRKLIKDSSLRLK